MLEQEPTNGEGFAPAESAAPATEETLATPRKATKRALVTLHPDDKIEIFEAR